MMNKKRGMAIFSMILVIQLIVPLVIWSYESYKNNELEEKGQEIKIFVDTVDYCDYKIEISTKLLESAMYDVKNFIVFKIGENGFANPEVVSELPDTDLYITGKKLYTFYRSGLSFKYESEITMSQDEPNYYNLYDRMMEEENIINGYCEGPATQAYAVFKVYKNRAKIVDVYIEGMPVDTVIEKYNNNEYDTSRYEYGYSYDYEDIFGDVYDAVVDEVVTQANVA